MYVFIVPSTHTQIDIYVWRYVCRYVCIAWVSVKYAYAWVNAGAPMNEMKRRIRARKKRNFVAPFQYSAADPNSKSDT